MDVSFAGWQSGLFDVEPRFLGFDRELLGGHDVSFDGTSQILCYVATRSLEVHFCALAIASSFMWSMGSLAKKLMTAVWTPSFWRFMTALLVQDCSFALRGELRCMFFNAISFQRCLDEVETFGSAIVVLASCGGVQIQNTSGLRGRAGALWIRTTRCYEKDSSSGQ